MCHCQNKWHCNKMSDILYHKQENTHVKNITTAGLPSCSTHLHIPSF